MQVERLLAAGPDGLYWGLNLPQVKLSNVSPREGPERAKPRVLVGCSEDQTVVSKISQQFTVIQARGAGHKLLMVILGEFSSLLRSLRLSFYPQGCVRLTSTPQDLPTSGTLVLPTPSWLPWEEASWTSNSTLTSSTTSRTLARRPMLGASLLLMTRNIVIFSGIL